jgi:hypothetical protein
MERPPRAGVFLMVRMDIGLLAIGRSCGDEIGPAKEDAHETRNAGNAQRRFRLCSGHGVCA